MHRPRTGPLIVSTIGVVLVGLLGLPMLGQFQVNLRTSGPPPGGASVRYSGLYMQQRALPSESRGYSMSAGLLPSQDRGLRMSQGNLPSQGAYAHLGPPTIRYGSRYTLAAPSRVPATLRYGTNSLIRPYGGGGGMGRSSFSLGSSLRVPSARISPARPMTSGTIRYGRIR